MRKLTKFILSGIVLAGVAACGDTASTTTNVPNSSPSPAESPASPPQTDQSPTSQSPAGQSNQAAQDDATSNVRRDQLDSDIRSREQRNNITGGDADRANGDLASEVRSKLEANITQGNLKVEAKDGTVTVSGTVPTQADLNKIDPLAKQIKGVKNVSVNAKVAPAGQ